MSASPGLAWRKFWHLLPASVILVPTARRTHATPDSINYNHISPTHREPPRYQIMLSLCLQNGHRMQSWDGVQSVSVDGQSSLALEPWRVAALVPRGPAAEVASVQGAGERAAEAAASKGGRGG